MMTFHILMKFAMSYVPVWEKLAYLW